MNLEVLFLGTTGSAPTAQRAPIATLVRRGGDTMLFDCGEGTQRQLLLSTGLIDLGAIFITHFHADHVLGLPGIIQSFGLRKREAPLTIYGPPGLHSLWEALKAMTGQVTYPIHLKECSPYEKLCRDGYLITPFEVHHRGRAFGYAIVETDRHGRFDDALARELGVAAGPDFGRLQRGEAVVGSKGEVRPDQVVGAVRPGRKVVLTGDTRPCDTTRALAYCADLLVHEATFTSEERERASKTGHSTARQAAETAAHSRVALLALNHVSARHSAGAVRREAREAFADTIVPGDLDRVEIPLPERGRPVYVRADGQRTDTPSRRPSIE